MFRRMGAPNPDRLISPPSPLTALTLAEIHVAGWALRASCNRCRTQLRVSLPAAIRAQGPDAIPWGMRPPCPGFDCEGGVLTYSARAVPSGSWIAMSAPPGPGVVAAWKAKRRIADKGPRNT
jgi:hypothetical protein